MGDLIGEAVSGTLYYVAPDELSRIQQSNCDAGSKVEIFAYMCRINALYMIAKAGSGHIGSSFSSMEIMSHLYMNEVYPSVDVADGVPDADAIFYSSKGHDSPAMYSVLIGLGVLDFDLLGRLRRRGGLPGHPDVGTPAIVTNTGSLGMGVSKAKGFIKANRLKGKHKTVFVLTGDGELQEGQFWESLVSAANHKLDELTVIIDHNKLQSDTLVTQVSDLGDLEAKAASFGWHVERCDGNDVSELMAALARCKEVKERPQIIVADTVKGKGVSFMEHTSIDSDVENYKFHSGAPSQQHYQAAVSELIQRTNDLLSAAGMMNLSLESEHAAESPKPSGRQQRLIPAYSEAILQIAGRRDDLVALDADLVLDTGLIPFQEKYPNRFIECGIAEQDMVSQAGAPALSGMLPIAHSFACFLSARPREQIYNNASEHTKVIYVGSLAGVLPGGPGHSHQGVGDIGSLGHIPGMSVIVPGCEEDVAPLLAWAVDHNQATTYMRLESIPVNLDFGRPEGIEMRQGVGYSITNPALVKLFTYGPTMISIALEASQRLAEISDIDVEIVNFPWVNHVDREWFNRFVNDGDLVVSLENHFIKGALGDRIAATLAAFDNLDAGFLHIGLQTIPVGGRNEEVLSHHALDAESICQQITSKVNQRQK